MYLMSIKSRLCVNRQLFVAPGLGRLSLRMIPVCKPLQHFPQKWRWFGRTRLPVLPATNCIHEHMNQMYIQTRGCCHNTSTKPCLAWISCYADFCCVIRVCVCVSTCSSTIAECCHRRCSTECDKKKPITLNI